MIPKIFIASPLFNDPQIAIITAIETQLIANGYDFYSARLHSGSDRLSPEEKKDIRAWDPVFDSNERGLNECRVMIAVLEYALPKRDYPASIRMGLLDCPELEPFSVGTSFTPVELPDAGTVWECGYHRAQGKLVLGFHTDKAKHLNLMLSHGCDGLIRGWENLEGFLSSSGSKLPGRLIERASKMSFEKRNELLTDAHLFDWSYTEDWNAGSKEVE